MLGRVLGTGRRFELVELFLQPPLLNAHVATDPANKSWEITGTNAGSGDVSGKSTGGWTVPTHGASGDSIIVQPHSDTKQSVWYSTGWLAERHLAVSFLVRLNTDSNQRFELGLRTTRTAFDDTTDNDKIIVRGVDNGNLYVVSSTAGTDVTEDTGVACTAGETYEIAIAIDTDGRTYVQVNGQTVNTPASHVLGASANLGQPYVAIKATAAAVKSFVPLRIGAAMDLA